MLVGQGFERIYATNVNLALNIASRDVRLATSVGRMYVVGRVEARDGKWQTRFARCVDYRYGKAKVF